MADIFDVVADGTRRRLLRCLLDRSRSGGELSVGELVAELGLSQPTVSKHLKVLRDHGLVAVREEGQHRYYRINAEPLAEVEEWLIPFLGTRAAAERPSAGEAAAVVPSLSGAAARAGDLRPQDAAAIALWEGAEAVGRAAGRVAANAANSAWDTIDTIYGRLVRTRARLERRRNRSPDQDAPLEDRIPSQTATSQRR